MMPAALPSTSARSIVFAGSSAARHVDGTIAPVQMRTAPMLVGRKRHYRLMSGRNAMNRTVKWGMIAALGLCSTFAALPAGAETCPPVERQPITRTLMELVQSDEAVRQDLTASLASARRINDDPATNPVDSLEAYYDLIDALVTYDPRNIPTGPQRGAGMHAGMDGANYCNWNILDLISYTYFLVDRQLTTDPRGQIQFQNDAFSRWLRGVTESWGAYLETPASAQYLPEFTGDPNFGDWYCPPEGGYATFQDFFTRELCADTFPNASRPVAGRTDPRTVVAIGDSTPAGTWPISDRGHLVTSYDGIAQNGMVIKGQLYSSIPEFIAGRPGERVLESFGSIDTDLFHGGTFTHQFLNVNNYHRLHLPVSGKLVYMRHFQSGVRLKSGWVSPEASPTGDGFYDPMDTPDWQFGQTRLVLGIETERYGTVIAAPMGMAQVSAIRLRDWVKEGAAAEKGWEFANFAFGGSDFVIIFQDKAGFRLTAATEPAVPPGSGVTYKLILQGRKYGCIGGGTDCDGALTEPKPYPGHRR
ncbi:phosphatidylserine decarboxylase [Marinibaculum pumilum]|uniref:Phosphatidylserine decarboxylase n=1 Tax=Marinibaculum pumilum TaxID=1766165 RepID=A0ABV7L9L1_9PROT